MLEGVAVSISSLQKSGFHLPRHHGATLQRARYYCGCSFGEPLPRKSARPSAWQRRVAVANETNEIP
jgi:hypothetical protein